MKKISLIILFIIVLRFNLCFAAEDLKINFIDVGYGDCILIQTDSKNALIDTGGLLYGYKVIDCLRGNKVKKLDFLIITHPDLDHIGGAFFIVPKLAINKVFDNGQDFNGDEHICRWYKKLIRERKEYSVLVAGNILNLGEVQLEVLWPDKPNITGSFNTNSLVIMLKYKGFRCLLTGDLTNIGEKRLLDKHLDLKCDVLKVGHHGYLDATSPQFLQAVSAQYAIISAGEKDKQGTPSGQTIERLSKNGINIYRTDVNGNIVISVAKDGKFTINSQR